MTHFGPFEIDILNRILQQFYFYKIKSDVAQEKVKYINSVKSAIVYKMSLTKV